MVSSVSSTAALLASPGSTSTASQAITQRDCPRQRKTHALPPIGTGTVRKIVCDAVIRDAGAVALAATRTVVPLCYRRCMAVRKKRSISIPPELDAEIAAAAEAAGLSYSAWVAQTARKEFTIRAGLEAVGQYEADHGALTPAEIAEADEWAARVIRPANTRRSA
jgi:hypothetical protein